MPPTQALYYPWIDIRDEAWLKTSLLYWDTVRTIVPESIETPYSSETGCALQEAGFLVPLRVHSRMEEIEELTDDALTYLNKTEGGELLVARSQGRRHHIHLDKLSTNLVRLPMFHQKLGHEVLHFLSSRASPSSRGPNWLDVPRGGGPRINLANPRVTNPVDLLKPGGRLVGEAGSSSRIRLLQGGETEARPLFEQLTRGGRVLENSTFPGTLVEFPGGGKIGFRPISKSGPPTIGVFIRGSALRRSSSCNDLLPSGEVS